MSDPIAAYLLGDNETRDEAATIYGEFTSYTNNSDENATIMAAAWLFEDFCDERDIDPIDALCQLLDIERPEMTTDA